MGEGFEFNTLIWVESYNDSGLLRGDTQCDHLTTSFNYDVYDLNLLQFQSKLSVGEFDPAHL